jgi:hypothetical protein
LVGDEITRKCTVIPSLNRLMGTRGCFFPDCISNKASEG